MATGQDTASRTFSSPTRHFVSLTALFIVLLLVLSPSPSRAVDVFLTGGGGEYSNLSTSTFSDIPFRNIIRQRFDYSCGSAALATLLSYHYEHPVTEGTVLKQMYAHGDQEKIRKEGFSLLDMKSYLASIGMQADGFREPLEKLTDVGVPAIALLNINGYLHFVVIKGVREDAVLMADPALGTKIVSREDFAQMWNGIVFVITNKIDIARRHFNQEQHWAFLPKAPFDHSLQLRTQQLGTIALDMVRTPGYY